MHIAGYYILLLLVYSFFGAYGLFFNYINIDIIYFIFISFLVSSVISIIVDVIKSKKSNKPLFSKDIYKNKDFITISFLNCIRMFLFTVAISFKNVDIVTTSYLTFPIYVAIMSKSILNINISKKEIIGIVISIIGIIAINYQSIKNLFTEPFCKITFFQIIYPLLGAVIFSYQIILSKKYSHLDVNNIIMSQFLPVLPFTFFIALVRRFYPFKNIFNFLLAPSRELRLKYTIYCMIFSTFQFYIAYYILFIFTKKYSALLTSILSYISIFVSFIVQRYYFGKHIRFYKIIASLFVLAGIILIAYSEHKIKKKNKIFKDLS